MMICRMALGRCALDLLVRAEYICKRWEQVYILLDTEKNSNLHTPDCKILVPCWPRQGILSRLLCQARQEEQVAPYCVSLHVCKVPGGTRVGSFLLCIRAALLQSIRHRSWTPIIIIFELLGKRPDRCFIAGRSAESSTGSCLVLSGLDRWA